MVNLRAYKQRGHQLWYAYLIHRISGLALTLFLPFHFYLLAMTVSKPEKFDAYIAWAELPIVKFAEHGLVFLLAVHMFGGIRLLAFEFLPWSSMQKTLAALSFSLSFLIALAFLLRAI